MTDPDRTRLVPFPEVELHEAARRAVDAVETAVDARPEYEVQGGQRYLRVDGITFAPELDFGLLWGWVWTLTGAAMGALVVVAVADALPALDRRVPWAGFALSAVAGIAALRLLRCGLRLIGRSRRHGAFPRAGRYVLSDGYLIRGHPWRHRPTGEVRSIQWIPWSEVDRVEIERHRAGGPMYRTRRWVDETRLVFSTPSGCGRAALRAGIYFDRGGRPLHHAIVAAHEACTASEPATETAWRGRDRPTDPPEQPSPDPSDQPLPEAAGRARRARPTGAWRQ